MIQTGIEFHASEDRIDATMSEIREYGFDAIDYQTFASPSHELYKMSEKTAAAYYTAFGKRVKDAGLFISQAHGLWPTDDTSKEKREQNRACFLREIAACGAMGCHYLVIHPMMPFGWGDGHDPDTIYGMNFDLFRSLLPTAHENGVTLCVENMPFLAIETSKVSVLRRLIDDVGDYAMKACFDTGHANFFHDDVAEDVRIFGDKLAVLHIHDNNGQSDSHCMPYIGNIAWDTVTDALRDIGYTGVFSLETEVRPSVPEPVRTSLCHSLSDAAHYLAAKI